MEHEQKNRPERPVVAAWGMPHGKQPPTLCAIVGIGEHAFVTACNGGWRRTDHSELFIGAEPPPRRKRCGRCAELAGVPADPTAVAPPGAIGDWDLSDLGGEG